MAIISQNKFLFVDELFVLIFLFNLLQKEHSNIIPRLRAMNDPLFPVAEMVSSAAESSEDSKEENAPVVTRCRKKGQVELRNPIVPTPGSLPPNKVSLNTCHYFLYSICNYKVLVKTVFTFYYNALQKSMYPSLLFPAMDEIVSRLCSLPWCVTSLEEVQH